MSAECPNCSTPTLRRDSTDLWTCTRCLRGFDADEVLGGPAPARQQHLASPPPRRWASLEKAIDAKGLERVACPTCGAPASLEHLVVQTGGRRRRRTIRRCWRRRSPRREACAPAVDQEEDLPVGA